MATILLQAAGGALGGLIGGPFGAVAGRALGALGGYAIDNRLMGGTGRQERGRLHASRVMEADEGGGVARVYGTARVAGQVIWTTRFEEVSQTERQGGKGGAARGPATTVYSYYGNVAVALCEGPIASVRRIWADGEELDLSQIPWRLHRGTETQAPDPLIEAKQGAGRAPAYQGLAYLVFERLPLERWGNRIPQISCEVIRPVGAFESRIRAITIIPGATEHGLDPLVVRERMGPGQDRLLNRNMLHDESDFSASLDELTALCPNLERAALVVAWFADDLRAGRATCRPGVETVLCDETEVWSVGGTGRGGARVVSQVDGGPAYGGTPSDAGVIRAIGALRAKGLKVTFYPFLLMDVPLGNGLADPYGAAEQAPFPWRGRMTLDLAETQAGTADRTAAARTDIERFVGSAQVADFSSDGEVVAYGGPVEWSYRRMILHQAHLARAAGGVDAFVIGSEMRGLTRLRDEAGRFPFVEALVVLARDVKAILPGALVTYAADWSEYFGYLPGNGDVFFNLDPLWAEPAIGAVGIDNYLPLTDWRDEAGDSLQDGMASPYDVEGLVAGITGGEHADWFYADGAARVAGERSAITDGLGRPWVFRAKDILSWWSEPHRERRAGVEAAAPTPWVPRSKPIWFTELGCPAIDKGANQPNVFVDPKSAESALPHFSTGARDDLQQRRFLEAHQRHWDEAVPGFQPEHNPLSPLYGGRMVPAGAVHLWTWDARPFPAFPERGSLWRDGDNWQRGHWLNGRLGRAPMDGLIAALLRDHGFEAFDVSEVDGMVGGFVVPGPGSARGELEELMRLTGVEAFAHAGVLRFRSTARRSRQGEAVALVDADDEPIFEVRRVEDGAAPGEVVVGFSDGERAYRPAAAEAVLPGQSQPGQASVDLPVVLTEGEARGLARGLLDREAGEREMARFALSPAAIEVGAGDRLAIDGRPGVWQVTRIEDGLSRRVEARRIGRRGTASAIAPSERPAEGPGPVFASRPVVALLDLPVIDGGRGGAAVAVSARPWMPYVVMASATGSGHAARATASVSATLGHLAAALGPGREEILDRTHALVVDLVAGSVSSLAPALVDAGGNTAAVRASNGAWEVLRFREAEEIAPSRFRLRGLSRGIGGTGEEAAAGAAAGALFVLLDHAVESLGIADGEAGTAIDWRTVPLGRTLDDAAADRRTAALGRRALRPLSPVHLRGRLDGSGLRLVWIRRTRSADPAWDGTDVALGEESEAYRVTLMGGTTGAELTVGAPGLTLSVAELEARLGGLPDTIAVEVAQLGQSYGPGAPARLMLARRP
ncbi:glycoside hydrolase/phage tail family protein [Aureimonas sp. SK2]|uniref:baseplate multidomain protein megatron n=1 Tax=Aureimonas sp. SK2 TaxID=3015992 RepID=UPI002444F335|nr:glycoside hydrolase/phage tail family protein [Aureimonas sp. SK2]